MTRNMSICFIGGTGRSGTTVLKKTFDQHPDVFCPGQEIRIINDPDGLIDFYNSMISGWSYFSFDKKIRRLDSFLSKAGSIRPTEKIISLVFKYSGLRRILPCKPEFQYNWLNLSNICPKYSNLKNEFINNLLAFKYPGYWVGSKIFSKYIYYGNPKTKPELTHIIGNFLQNIVRNTLEYYKCKHFVNDDAMNFIWFDKIQNFLPNAKLIHIYRDPRDVVCSYTKQKWGPADPVQSMEIYKDLMDRWLIVKQELPDESFMQVSLEKLVNDTKSTIKEICLFLNVDFHTNLLRIDLSKSNSGRWKKELNHQQKDIMNKYLGKYIHVFGYDI